MSSQTTYDLELSVVIAAQPATIFRYFQDPARFSEWLGAKASFEPRAGSVLRIEFPPSNSPDCADGSVMAGEVLEIKERSHFAFTWGQKGGPQEAELPPGSTRVDITLAPHDDGTLVTLRHSGLPSEKQRQMHTPGWRHYLCQLSLKSTQVQLGDVARDTVAAWFEAWSETDPTARVRLLEKSWHENGQLQDEYALVEGVDAVNAHIGAAQIIMPGMKLQAAGAVQVCHSNVRFGWKATDPQGHPIATGTNFGELAADGRLKKLVGFATPQPAE